MSDKPIASFKDKDIVMKEITRPQYYPFCPRCDTELYDTGKDYRPYWCECGDWYWVEDEECYKIHK